MDPNVAERPQNNARMHRERLRVSRSVFKGLPMRRIPVHNTGRFVAHTANAGEDDPMRAHILSIGSELIRGDITDTNATYLAQELAALGIELLHVTQVGDDRPRLIETIRQAASGAELIICTGGVGPTAGQYSLNIFGPGSYTVTPSKTGGTNTAINSFDAGKIDVVLASHLPYQRRQRSLRLSSGLTSRIFHLLGGRSGLHGFLSWGLLAGRRLGRRCGCGRLCRRRCFCRRLSLCNGGSSRTGRVVNPRHHRIDPDRLAFRDQNFGERTGRRRWNFRVYLVSRNFE
jgi:hypothetical protein